MLVGVEVNWAVMLVGVAALAGLLLWEVWKRRHRN